MFFQKVYCYQSLIHSTPQQARRASLGYFHIIQVLLFLSLAVATWKRKMDMKKAMVKPTTITFPSTATGH